MWHEARRQERKIRGMLVDYRRRAERRRDFYEKIKADPTQFLQIHGRQCKIHLDPVIATAADNAVMMPWQGQSDNLIDRFDVRAHLDYIPPVKKEEECEPTQEERQLNYERYRIIAQNSFLSIAEEKFLKQLHLEEQFGYTETKTKKEQPRTGGVAIGFNYEDGTAPSQIPPEHIEEESDENSDSDLDVDLAINVSKMDATQAHDMNKHGRSFGMSSNDFYSFLTNDLEEAETYRLAKEEEHEKALFSGRKSRRERRAHREKRLANRVISPPSYAARTSPTYPTFRESKSPSKSPTPEATGKITYITSFGGEEEHPTSSKPSYADKVKHGKAKLKGDANTERTVYYSKRSRSNSRERNDTSRKRIQSRSISKLSRSKPRRSRSRSISKRSRSRSRRKSRSHSRSKSSSKRSRSRSINRYKRSKISREPQRSYRSRRSTSSSISSSSASTKSSASPRKRVLSSSSSSLHSSLEDRKSDSPDLKNSELPKVIPRYYGRKKSDQSSSELSDASNQEEAEINDLITNETKSSYGNSGTAIKKTAAQLTIQEKLKRKRQALLNKQFKADKIAEQIKTEREKQEQQTREDELREMAIKLRRRQREKRHAFDSNRSSSDSDSESHSKSPVTDKQRSVSLSPKRKSRERDYKESRKHEHRRGDHSRDNSRDREHRNRSREKRDSIDRRSSAEEKNPRREHSLPRKSPQRHEEKRNERIVYRESARHRSNQWRDDKRRDDRRNKSLVDY